jgi:ATP-dependent helicase/nuclease subunit A
MYKKIYLDPYKSCWISANAGTGKTKITIDRILALLLSGSKASSILAITFTNNAADEMKYRIINLVNDLLKLTDDELLEYLQNFLSQVITRKEISQYRHKILIIEEQLSELKIQTLHAFCQSLLQDFSEAAGLKENFKIIDENYAQIILSDAKEEIFNHDKITATLNNILNKYSYNYFADILDDIASSRNKLAYIWQNYEDLNQYINKTYQFLEIKPLEDYESKIYQDFFSKMDQDFINELAINIAISDKDKDKEKVQNLKSLQQNWVDNFAEAFMFFQAAFCKKDQEFYKKLVTKDIAAKISDYDTKIADLNELYNYYNNLLNKYNYAELTVDIMLIAQIFLMSYDKIKLQKNLIDYEDLILKSLLLLKSSTNKEFILYKLYNNIHHLLIDEAQDISPWQWDIVKLILEDFFASQIQASTNNSTTKITINCAENNSRSFFIVGDEKQSIYGFQGVNHYLFTEIKSEFSQKMQESGKILHEIALQTSYRSGSTILTLVDKLANLPEIYNNLTVNQDKKIEHRCFRENINNKVVIWPESPKSVLVETNYWQYPKKIIKKSSPYDEVAKQIAQFIKEALDKESASNLTKINASDILILCRKRGGLYNAIINKLAIYNIIVESDNSVKILNYILIMDLISLLRFVIFSEDSLNLAALLKSPLFSFSEEEIFNLCHDRGDVSIWQILQSKLEYQEVFKKLLDIKQTHTILDIKEFYLYYLNKYQLRQKYYLLYGKLAEDLINLFLQIIDNFMEYDSDYLSFLEYLTRCDIKLKNKITNNKDSVKLLTIHASKGLQAPIVILATEPYSKNSFKKNSFNFNFEHNLLTLQLQNISTKLTNSSKNQQDLEQAEEYRLLYVALTRARDELHVFSIASKENRQLCYYNLINKAASNISAFIRDKNDCLIYQEVSETQPTQSIEPDIAEFNLSMLAIDSNSEHNLKNIIKASIKEPVLSNKSIMIGNIYHELFYALSLDYNNINREKIIAILANYQDLCEQNKLAEILAKTINIIEKYREVLFSDKGFNELSLTMKDQGNIINGKIDRLLITQDHAQIIDYKLSVSPQNLSGYKQQLTTYEQLVKANFAVNKISKYLFDIEQEELKEL